MVQNLSISSRGGPGESCPARCPWARSDALHGSRVFQPMEQLSVSFPTASGTRCAAAWGMINHILV